MNALMFSFIERYVLNNFRKISLSQAEQQIYNDAMIQKIIPSITATFFVSICTVPPILFLDSETLITILIPITMVTGGAWFAISVANIKKKFEGFALELITSMYKSFSSSLFILLLIGIFSFFEPFTTSITLWGSHHVSIQLLAGFIGIIPIGYIIWHLYIGALKYDINDSMLAGQHEVAEQYFKDALFKRSLNLLYVAVEKLRDGKSLSVANYYLGIAFTELFTYMHTYFISMEEAGGVIFAQCSKLRNFPSMQQQEADTICVQLIQYFMLFVKKHEQEESIQKCIKNIRSELVAMAEKEEEQTIVDSRMATILEEIAEILKFYNQESFSGV